MVALVFEWDSGKAAANRRKHGIGFEEASTVFGDTLSVTIGDPLHSADEQRFVIIGRSRAGKVLVVVHAERGDRIRLISARRATRGEQVQYEET